MNLNKTAQVAPIAYPREDYVPPKKPAYTDFTQPSTKYYYSVAFNLNNLGSRYRNKLPKFILSYVAKQQPAISNIASKIPTNWSAISIYMDNNINDTVKFLAAQISPQDISAVQKFLNGLKKYEYVQIKGLSDQDNKAYVKQQSPEQTFKYKEFLDFISVDGKGSYVKLNTPLKILQFLNRNDVQTGLVVSCSALDVQMVKDILKQKNISSKDVSFIEKILGKYNRYMAEKLYKAIPKNSWDLLKKVASRDSYSKEALAKFKGILPWLEKICFLLMAYAAYAAISEMNKKWNEGRYESGADNFYMDLAEAISLLAGNPLLTKWNPYLLIAGTIALTATQLMQLDLSRSISPAQKDIAHHEYWQNKTHREQWSPAVLGAAADIQAILAVPDYNNRLNYNDFFNLKQRTNLYDVQKKISDKYPWLSDPESFEYTQMRQYFSDMKIYNSYNIILNRIYKRISSNPSFYQRYLSVPRFKQDILKAMDTGSVKTKYYVLFKKLSDKDLEVIAKLFAFTGIPQKQQTILTSAYGNFDEWPDILKTAYALNMPPLEGFTARLSK
jgi:hypothetical protein